MNNITKIFFWIFTIALGFVNPLISFGLIILYYLPGIIQNLCPTCKEECEIEHTDSSTKTMYKPEQESPKMNSFSEDTLEDLK